MLTGMTTPSRSTLIVTFCFPSSAAIISIAAQENCGEALNLEDADIRSVVDEIAMRTGKKFVLDPRVAGKVTIKSGPNGGLCADEAWEIGRASGRERGWVS